MYVEQNGRPNGETETNIVSKQMLRPGADAFATKKASRHTRRVITGCPLLLPACGSGEFVILTSP